jgi:hypothetical protein
MPALTLPANYPRIQVVESYEALVNTPFGGGVNALCWQRSLPGDFAEVVRQLGVMEGITTLDEAVLKALVLSPAGQAAREVLIEDQRRLRDHGLAPILDAIQAYPRDDEPGPVPTDVYSFHVDSATVETDTFLCSYTEIPSEGLRNDEAVRKVDVPDLRKELLDLWGEGDDEAFGEFLHDCCFDLHYAPLPQAVPFSFGVGHLWRIAVEYPGSPVPACIHRAVPPPPGQMPRLLLIS